MAEILIIEAGNHLPLFGPIPLLDTEFDDPAGNLEPHIYLRGFNISGNLKIGILSSSFPSQEVIKKTRKNSRDQNCDEYPFQHNPFLQSRAPPLLRFMKQQRNLCTIKSK